MSFKKIWKRSIGPDCITYTHTYAPEVMLQLPQPFKGDIHIVGLNGYLAVEEIDDLVAALKSIKREAWDEDPRCN